MKQLFFSVLLFSAIFAANSVKAQGYSNIVDNDGRHSDYYYLPDVDMYYYIPGRQYVYYEDGHWIFSRRLPSRHHDYDFAHGRRILVSGRNPYLHHDVHYRQYYGNGNGHSIGQGNGGRGRNGHFNRH